MNTKLQIILLVLGAILLDAASMLALRYILDLIISGAASGSVLTLVAGGLLLYLFGGILALIILLVTAAIIFWALSAFGVSI